MSATATYNVDEADDTDVDAVINCNNNNVTSNDNGNANNDQRNVATTDYKTVAKLNWAKVFAVKKFITLAKVQATQAPARFVVGGKYEVGKKIANGAFGQLRRGLNNETGAQVAIKLEHVNSKIPMLFLEFRFYKTLGHHTGLPSIYYFGTCGKYNALVMELLGPNLEELFLSCQRQFSLKTILLLALQLVTRLEFIHAHGIIYRDIKPENCLVGPLDTPKAGNVFMVDFGLAKEFIDPETGRHIPYVENKSLTGTVRYMSINSHQGKEQSRRDDLEALGHVFYYFLSGGNLPWQGVKCEDIRRRYQIIGHIKEETSVAEMGRLYPWEFSIYLRYCRALKFNQTPDYSYLKNLFKGCLHRIGGVEDYVFDWMMPRRHSVHGDTESSAERTSTSREESSTARPKQQEEVKKSPVASLKTRTTALAEVAKAEVIEKADKEESANHVEAKEIPANAQEEKAPIKKFETPLIIVHASEDDHIEVDKAADRDILPRIPQRGMRSLNKVRPVAKIEPIKKTQVRPMNAADSKMIASPAKTNSEEGKEVGGGEVGVEQREAEVVNFSSCCSSFSKLSMLFS